MNEYELYELAELFWHNGTIGVSFVGGAGKFVV